VATTRERQWHCSAVEARSWELRTSLRPSGAQGKQQQARELLAPVYGWFTVRPRDLKEANALLEELAA
jgi:hypothetical protein